MKGPLIWGGILLWVVGLVGLLVAGLQDIHASWRLGAGVAMAVAVLVALFLGVWRGWLQAVIGAMVGTFAVVALVPAAIETWTQTLGSLFAIAVVLAGFFLISFGLRTGAAEGAVVRFGFMRIAGTTMLAMLLSFALIEGLRLWGGIVSPRWRVSLDVASVGFLVGVGILALGVLTGISLAVLSRAFDEDPEGEEEEATSGSKEDISKWAGPQGD